MTVTVHDNAKNGTSNVYSESSSLTTLHTMNVIACKACYDYTQIIYWHTTLGTVKIINIIIIIYHIHTVVYTALHKGSLLWQQPSLDTLNSESFT